MESRLIKRNASKYEVIFFIFIIGCIIGTLYEEALNFIKFGTWESRSGLIYGPFNPIYGAGFAAFAVALGKNIEKRSKVLTYIYCCLVGGITEYFLSFFTEKIFNVFSWNYKDYFLNVNGRTTIPFMIIWGIGGYIFLVYIYPRIVSLLDNVSIQLRETGMIFLTVFMILNMSLSAIAVLRQSERNVGIPASNVVESFCDKYYSDEFLYKIYPNMIHMKE